MVNKKRRKYTAELKEEALKLIMEQSYQVAEAARNSGINASVLGRWRPELEGEVEASSSLGNAKALRVELKRLLRENKRLKLEREILKGQPSLRESLAEVSIHFIDTARKAYPIALLCEVMRVSRSGYYVWRKRSNSLGHGENERLIPLVRDVHRESKGTYGTRIESSRRLRIADTACLLLLIYWIGNLKCQSPTACGFPTLPIFGRLRAGCTW